MSHPLLDAPVVADFIRTHHRTFVFCRDGARCPIGYAMRSVAYRSETRDLYFSTYTKSPKVRHLLADPEVACLVGDDASWVSACGVAEVYRASPTEVDDLIGDRSPDDRVPASVVAKVRDRLLDGKRSLIKVTLTDVRAANLPGLHDQ